MPKFLEVSDITAARAYLTVPKVVDVTAYGAVGDGVTDDRAAIHAARDAAGVGGNLYFPAGTYLIEMLDNATPGYKYGAGGLHANVAGQTWHLGSSRLVLAGDQVDNLITVDAQNVSIVGGTLDLSDIADTTDFVNAGIAVWSGTGPSAANYGTHGSNSSGAVIKDVTINDAPNHAVWILSTDSVTVTGCALYNFFKTGIFLATNVANSAGNSDYLIHGNRLESNSKSYAACLYIGANDQSFTAFETPVARYRRARITANSCVIPRDLYPGEGSFFDGGAEEGAIQVMNAEDSVIDGNTTEGGTFGITTAFLRRVAISNNTLTGWRGAGIELSGGLDGVNVTGNVVDSDGAGGPYDQATGLQDPDGELLTSISGILSSCNSYCMNLTISGNTITGFTTSARAYGVQLYNALRPSAGGTFENVIITGNTISADGGSTNFSGVLTYCPTDNLVIAGNIIDGYSRTTSRGIQIGEDTHTGMSIIGNTILNMDTEAVNLSGTSFTDVRYTGNLIRNCALGINGSGIATATGLVVDNTSPSTSTATAAGTTTLTSDSTDVQIFTGTTTQTVDLPTTHVLAGRRFTVVNNSTGSVTVRSSAGNNIEIMRAKTSATFVALQNTPTSYAHWITTASGESAALNRLQPQSGASQSNLVADGFDSDIAINLYSKAAGLIRFRNSAGTTFFAGVPVTSGVNWLTVSGSVAGSAPFLRTSGSDSNIDLNLVTTGTGVVQANGNPVGVKVAVPASAGATGVVGQWAAESGWLYICVATNTWERVAIASW